MKKFVCVLLLIGSSYLYAQTKILVLGTAQDGGFPHLGCQKECQAAWEDPSLRKYVVSLAVIDESENKWWLFEATPDITEQLHHFQQWTNKKYPFLPEGIFITHAHIGHYTGLMQLGFEAMGAKSVNVYVLPKLAAFLEGNGPWSQLVDFENIVINRLTENETIELTGDFQTKTYRVPHRDEFSETAGFQIITSGKKNLFIPDIDKWEKWEFDILEEVKNNDRAFIDGSFFADGELADRSMDDIPHPFVSETMNLFEDQPDSVKSRIFFIHFNHTNPLLWDATTRMKVISAGFNMAVQGKFYE